MYAACYVESRLSLYMQHVTSKADRVYVCSMLRRKQAESMYAACYVEGRLSLYMQHVTLKA